MCVNESHVSGTLQGGRDGCIKGQKQIEKQQVISACENASFLCFTPWFTSIICSRSMIEIQNPLVYQSWGVLNLFIFLLQLPDG